MEKTTEQAHPTRPSLRDNTGGFTFIEMLLVLFIFVILVITASDIFNRTQRTQARATGLQRLQDDMRYVVTKITNDIRTGGVDYDCYKRPDNSLGYCNVEIFANGNTILALKDARNRKRAYRISSAVGANECADDASKPCLLISDNDGQTWQSMTSKSVRLDAAKSMFFIRPDKNPFYLDPATNAYLSNEQPRVHIRLELLSDVRGVSESARLPLQTTVVSREYKR